MNRFNAKMKRKGAFLMLTHAQGFAMDDGMTVPRKIAEEMTGTGLFETPLPIQRKGCLRLVAAEDGLFPGFSQTWRAED